MTLKEISRKLYSNFFYIFLKNYLFKKSNLKNGISAVICLKNEEYTIPFAIKSLIGFADQIICIDNGSSDNSINTIKKVIREVEGLVDIELIYMPDKLLGDCRNEGLRKSKYRWHLRWDADMIAIMSGKNSILKIREQILKLKYPYSFQLPRTNIYGDFHHTFKSSDVIDEGESFLVYNNNNLKYIERGRFDCIRIPLYYKMKKIKVSHIVHLSTLKSEVNLIHRFHYFTWRYYTNSYSDFNLSFNKFKKMRELYLFNTNNTREVKYRYNLQAMKNLKKYDPERYGELPKILINEFNKERFKVLYKDNEPFFRIDLLDEDLKEYKPTIDDEKWDVNSFLKKINEESVEKYL